MGPTESKTSSLQDATHAAIETFYNDYPSLNDEKKRVEKEIFNLVSELSTAGKTVTLGLQTCTPAVCENLCRQVLEPVGITLTVSTIVKNVGSPLAPVSTKFSTFTSAKKSS